MKILCGLRHVLYVFSIFVFVLFCYLHVQVSSYGEFEIKQEFSMKSIVIMFKCSISDNSNTLGG